MEKTSIRGCLFKTDYGSKQQGSSQAAVTCPLQTRPGEIQGDQPSAANPQPWGRMGAQAKLGSPKLPVCQVLCAAEHEGPNQATGGRAKETPPHKLAEPDEILPRAMALCDAAGCPPVASLWSQCSPPGFLPWWQSPGSL